MVIGTCFPRHRAAEFRRFLDEIDANVPADLDIHLVLDNSATHKTKLIRDWLAKRPRYHVHFTPTSASWINQVERWFALLTARQLRRGVHRSVADLERAIRAFIDATNTQPKPFRWVKSADDILASVRRFCLRTLGGHAGPQALLRTSELGHSGTGPATGIGSLEDAAPAVAAACPALASILRSTRVRTAVASYGRQDAEARREQWWLFREVAGANLCLLLAGVLSGLVLAGGAGHDRLAFVLGLLTPALGAGAAMLSYRAREGDRLRRWLTLRSRGETARAAAFQTIAERAAKIGSPAAMYGLGVVSRHLLDEQRRWLAKQPTSRRRPCDTPPEMSGIMVPH